MRRVHYLGWMAVAAVSAVAMAQTATPAKSEAEAKTAIEARQQVFKDMKRAYEPLTDMLKNKRPFDAALVATNAAELQKLGAKIPSHFTVDTRQFKGTETRALDGIWASLADFNTKADAFGKAAANVAAVAATGDAAATRKAIPEIGKSCGACHDNYQAKL